MKSLLKIGTCQRCKRKAEYLFIELEVIPNFGVKNNWEFLCSHHAVEVSHEKQVVLSNGRDKDEKEKQ